MPSTRTGSARSRSGTTDEIFEITTFRTDHDYADFRRPHRVEFGDSIELDLARRDFTVNAMAWGSEPGGAPAFLDPFGGLADVEAGWLRAVGDARTRFEEDALRMIRAVRLAATLGFGIEPATLAGIQARADLARHLSGERIAAELGKLLAAPVPSVGLRLMSDTDLLRAISPDLAAQRGIPQNKVPGEDLWDHTLRAVDAAPAARPVVRLATLLHDIGKPATFADGHFVGHDAVGAELAGAFMDRLRLSRPVHDRIVELVRNHMFSYEPNWSDAAVRRFIAKMDGIGPGALEELLELREADNVGSGLPAEAGRLAELRARVAAELAAEVVLDRRGLAIDGNDLMLGAGARGRTPAGTYPRRVAGAGHRRSRAQRPTDAAAPRPVDADGRSVGGLAVRRSTMKRIVATFPARAPQVCAACDGRPGRDRGRIIHATARRRPLTLAAIGPTPST